MRRFAVVVLALATACLAAAGASAAGLSWNALEHSVLAEIVSGHGQRQELAVVPAGGAAPARALRVRMQLLPQGAGQTLRGGVDATIAASQPVDGVATLSIDHVAAALAGIRGHGSRIAVGRGSISAVSGIRRLRLGWARGTEQKLARLRAVTLTLTTSLVSAEGERRTLTTARRY
jgi:hypothetical protein